MSLVQIYTRRVRADRVPLGKPPVFETDLEHYEHITDVTITELAGNKDRVTSDHVAVLTIVSRLGLPLAEQED